jgi:hypothetical protein
VSASERASERERERGRGREGERERGRMTDELVDKVLEWRLVIDFEVFDIRVALACPVSGLQLLVYAALSC